MNLEDPNDYEPEYEPKIPEKDFNECIVCRSPARYLSDFCGSACYSEFNKMTGLEGCW